MGSILGIWLDNANDFIGIFVKSTFLISLIVYFGDSTVKYFQEEKPSRALYLSVIVFLFLFIPFGGFICLTKSIAAKAECTVELTFMTVESLRWFGLFTTLPLWFFVSPYAVSRVKSAVTIFVHLSIFLVGWFFGEWIGIFFISIPILAIFYLFSYYLAQVIFPATNPEETTEKSNKFLAFFWYIWGMQYPHWVAESSATRFSEDRMKGKHIKRLGKPGIIWTHSHQVVARSTGIEFNSIDGPGILFTGQAERPITIVDLRMQLRPMPFAAVTKDGIEIKAFIFISFQIDRSPWEREMKHEFWRMNPVLQKGVEVEESPYIGFPYSGARVHASLSASTIDSWDNENTAEERHWDDVAIQRVLKEARLVLSEREFTELWTPVENDNRGSGAIDEMSSEIGNRARPELAKMVVELFGARIVNFIIDEDSSIYKQLKGAWLFVWDKKIAEIKFSGEAEAEKLKVDAKMSSRRVFMETVRETLQEAHDIDNNVLRQLTTLNFISTLEKLLEDVDNDEDTEDQTARISAWGRFMSSSRRDR